MQLRGCLLPVKTLTGKIDRAKGNSDHAVINLQSNQDVVVTESNKNNVVFSGYGSVSGITFENGTDSKSINTPSVLTSLTYNNAVLRSLPKGNISDTLVEKEDGTLHIERLCGHIVLDGTVSPSEIVQSGSDSVASGFFAVGWHDTKFDGAEVNTSNIYCNRLKGTTAASLAEITEPSVFIGERAKTETINHTFYVNTTLFIVLPTGTCEENETAISEWLGSHSIEVIYPLESPYAEEYDINCDLSLSDYSAIDTLMYTGNQHTVTRNITGGTPPYTCTYYTDEASYESGGIIQTPHEQGSLDNDGDTVLLNSTVQKCKVTVTDTNGNVKHKIFSFIYG